MSPPKDYTPIDDMPDLDGSRGFGPLKLQEDGDVVLWWETWRHDYAIASCSNTSPIVVTTATAHKFVSGQKVRILGSGDAHAEGTHFITVLSPTTFSLTATTADGGAGAGGRVWDPKLGLFSRLIDAAAWLANNIGAGALAKSWSWGGSADFAGDVLAANVTAISTVSADAANFVDTETVTLEVFGNASLGGNLGVTGNVAVGGNETVGGNLGVPGTVTAGTVAAAIGSVSGNLTVKNVIFSGLGASTSGIMVDSTTTTRTGSSTRSGAGAFVVNRRVAINVSATTVVTPESGDQFTVDGTAVASGIHVTLAAPAGGAALGPLWFTRRGSGPNHLHFFQPDGSTGLATLEAVTTVTCAFGVVWDGGQWTVIATSGAQTTVP